MDVFGKTVNEFLSEVDQALEHIYEYFRAEGVEILSGKNFYHTRIYRFVRTLENLCCSISALDIYTMLRQIYSKNSTRVHFTTRAKTVLNPYIRSSNRPTYSGLPTYLSTSSITDRAPALSRPACASR